MQRDRFAGRKDDPLSLNRYTYCRNNPIIFIDPSGYSYGTLPDGTKFSINSNWDAKKFYELRDKQLTQQAEQAKQAKQKLLDDRIKDVPQAKCDDYYDSIDEAAIDFVLQYGQESINSHHEYGTEINAVEFDGIIKYTLNYRKIGPERVDSTGYVDLEFEENTVAYVHTHGQYVVDANNYFSVDCGPGEVSDISLTYDNSLGRNIIAYVGVPNGNILVFDPAYDEIRDQANTGRVIFDMAPIDPEDPKWKVE